MDTGRPLLRVRGLGKVYADGHAALRDLDLDVPAGAFVVCIGLSGAGKSTLLRCLNRLVEPTFGSVELSDTDVTAARGEALRRARSRIAMIFQTFNLVKRASVLTNVLTGTLARYGTTAGVLGLWRREDREEALKTLALVGLEGFAARRADTLSGGQQQRVAIARALMQRPDVLLADEPVASLDPATSHAVMGILKRLQQGGLTVVANLHFLSLARAYGTAVVALKDGRKVFEGLPSEITNARFREIYGEDAVEVEAR